MKMFLAARAAVVILAGVIPATAVAADRFSFEGLAALEYDGRIRVDELDLDSRRGDFLALVETKIRARPINSAEQSVTIGYDFSQRSHFEFPNLNRQSHRLLADGRAKVGGAEVGAAYDFVHFRLGGNALVDIQGIEPRFSVPVADGTMISASYRYEHWNFAAANVRDADGHLLGLNVTQQLSRKVQLVVGGRYEKQDAVEPRFDFEGFQLNAALQAPLRVLGRQGSARLEYNFRDRDYSSITPTIGQRRREDRSVITGTAELSLSDRVGLRSAVRYTDRNSNFPASNYEEIRASAGVVVRL